MAELRGLSVKVPIRFSEKAQRDLYEICMAYKELAEARGAENAKLRELVRDMWTCIGEGEWDCSHYPPRYVICDDGVSEFMDRARELGLEVDDG